MERLAVGSQLRRNFTVTTVLNGVGMIASLISYPIYLKYLTLQQYGLWIALSAVISVVQLGGFGIAPAVTKYVAEECARGDIKAARAYSNSAFTLLTISGVSVALFATGCRGAVADLLKLPSDTYTLAKHLVPFVAFLSAYTFITQAPTGTLAGLGRQDQVAYIQGFARVVTLGASWATLMSGLGVWGLVMSNLAGLLVTHIWTGLMIRRAWPYRGIKLEFDGPRMRRMFRYGIGMMGSGLMLTMLHPLNRIILSRYGSVAVLPIFEIAYGGAMQIRSVFASAMTAMLPEFSRVDALGDSQRVRALIRRLYKIIYFAALPPQVLVFLLAPLMLKVWLRSGFVTDQVTPFRVMLIGSFFSLLGVPGYYYLAAIARVRVIFASHALQSALNVMIAGGFLLSLGGIGPSQLSIAVSFGLAASTVLLVFCTLRTQAARAAQA